MFIETENPLEVGTHLVLHFALPDADPVEGTARVVWIRCPGEEHPYPAGMAVKFLELPPGVRQPSLPSSRACWLTPRCPRQRKPLSKNSLTGTFRKRHTEP